jgi:nucleoside-diphosphate-sugar epimerase
MHILITGANGFIGRALCLEAMQNGLSVRAAVRKHEEMPNELEVVVIGEINEKTDWSIALRDVDVVIHLASRVNVMHEKTANLLDEFRAVNVAGTECLARAAIASGVKRFVFVSSIKVNGESTFQFAVKGQGNVGSQFTEIDEANPQDSYGISKWEAEQMLHQVSSETGLEVVIVRPPLVYGPGVKGNFGQMMKMLSKGTPLPLASIKNMRSLVYIGNFVDALFKCAKHPAAANKTYLVSDGEDVSTPQLLRQLGSAMSHPARLIPFSPRLLTLIGCLTGKSDQVTRLLGSLQVDSSKICLELGWHPPFTLQEGLKLTAEDQSKIYSS